MQQQTRESENERKERLTHLVLASKAVNPSLGFIRGCNCDATREGEKQHKIPVASIIRANYYQQFVEFSF